jgi:asparagine synthase (glutamine-hydrolysing)
MCGICGQFNLTGHPVEPATLRAMMAAIRHRGPDDEGHVVRGPAGLSHLRLSIIDLSEAGHQPMTSRDGQKWIVFNGEIYNYIELKRELEQLGETFRSSSDTEVLLRLYERFGPACLEKLQGMFAFAVWDEPRQTLFLARDRVGIKPLYYYLDDRRIVFASEIKAILQCADVSRQVNVESLITYFTFGHSVAPDTMYSRIHKLLPGHYMVCTAGGTHLTQYWDLSQNPSSQLGQSEATVEVRRILERAVTSHMVSDVPVGAFLSGGIDSSAVVAFMSQSSRQPIKTFAIGFDIGGYYNELDDARLIARHFRTDHYEKIVTQLDVRALIEKLVYHYDEPFADAANLPTFILSDFARQQVKVVLSGEGGDEVFGGYRRYCAQTASCYFHFLPVFMRGQFLNKIVPETPRFRRVRKVLETLSIQEEAVRYGTWLALFTEEAKAEMFDQTLRGTLQKFDSYWSYREYYNRLPSEDRINRILYTDLKGWLADTYLEKLDKAAMAVGLEGRVPFLDHRLIEYVFGLPGTWKVRRLTTKWLLKKALGGVLPDRTLYKPKHGFAVPVDEWFRGQLKNFLRDVLFDSDPRRSAYFRPAQVDKIFQQHIRGERNFGMQLWALLNFELWHRLFMRAGNQLVPAASDVTDVSLILGKGAASVASPSRNHS